MSARAGGDPDASDDPLSFDPDRFIDMTDEQRSAAEAGWVPFGGVPFNVSRRT